MQFGKPHIFWQCGFCGIALLAHAFVTDAKLSLVSCVAAPKHACTAMAPGVMVTTLSMFLQNIFLHWTHWQPQICQTNWSAYLPVWYIWMIFLHAQKALLVKIKYIFIWVNFWIVLWLEKCNKNTLLHCHFRFVSVSFFFLSQINTFNPTLGSAECIIMRLRGKRWDLHLRQIL